MERGPWPQTPGSQASVVAPPSPGSLDDDRFVPWPTVLPEPAAGPASAQGAGQLRQFVGLGFQAYAVDYTGDTDNNDLVLATAAVPSFTTCSTVLCQA